MKLFILYLYFVLASSSYAETGQRDCFTKHLREAIDLNKDRRELYAQQSGGTSRKVSNTLIWFERLTWVSAKWFDWRAKLWQEQGVPLMCSEFVSMALSPSLSDSLVPHGDPKQSLDTYGLISSLNANLSNSYSELLNTVILAIREIESEPHYHCMQRHLLESIGRSAKLAPVYEKMSLEKGIKAPTFLIKKFLRLQIWGIKLGKYLDSMAQPLQKQGLGIICDDVPRIPLDFGIEPPLVLTLTLPSSDRGIGD
ncbi:MAG: hypothetical protein AB8G05_17370 [Oligoflexales bacterium]